ncbi:flagellar export protein FliJ [Vibrio sp.]|nr:flagellar export protein FliJ [Vibrio sp.]
MSDTFKILLEQAKDQEKQASLALQSAQQELSGYYIQLKQIEKYRLDYCQQLVDRGQKGLSASEFTHLNRFLTQLDNTLKQQQAAEGHFKDQVFNCEEHWQDTRKKRNSFEWLMEKKAKEARHLEAKQEQKLLDELAMQQYTRQSLR